MPRVWGVNHHPEIIDREHLLAVLEEKRAHGEVTRAVVPRSASHTLENEIFGDARAQSRLTSEYTFLGALRHHLQRFVSCEEIARVGSALSRAVQRAVHARAIYEWYVRELSQRLDCKFEFRLAESPVFLPDDFKARIDRRARKAIVDAALAIRRDARRDEGAPSPTRWDTPGMDALPNFTQVDFAVVRENGMLVPKLIELQGFPSLTCLQVIAARRLARRACARWTASIANGRAGSPGWIATRSSISRGARSPAITIRPK